MQPIEINYLAVLVATFSSVVLGSLWYGPIFGKPWMKMMGFKKQDMDAMAKKEVAKSYVLMMLGSLVMAFVLAHSLIFASAYLQIEGISAGLMAGLWNWLGFVAPTTMGSVLWEGKPWKLWMINSGFYLVSLSVMGVILAVWS